MNWGIEESLFMDGWNDSCCLISVISLVGPTVLKLDRGNLSCAIMGNSKKIGTHLK